MARVSQRILKSVPMTERFLEGKISEVNMNVRIDSLLLMDIMKSRNCTSMVSGANNNLSVDLYI